MNKKIAILLLLIVCVLGYIGFLVYCSFNNGDNKVLDNNIVSTISTYDCSKSIRDGKFIYHNIIKYNGENSEVEDISSNIEYVNDSLNDNNSEAYDIVIDLKNSEEFDFSDIVIFDYIKLEGLDKKINANEYIESLKKFDFICKLSQE